ncbi:MAG TPA: sugar ABC transporter substrate-binding protein [Limnochordia bacterium]|nr:sugar ABC transporter substrate-binding protein [Limnochordia bacterium]
MPLSQLTKHAAAGLALTGSLVVCALGAQAKTTLTLSIYSSGTTRPAFEAIEKAFEAQNPDIDVQLMLFDSGSYNDKLLAMFAAGSGPDVFLTWAQNKTDWIERGYVADLTDPFKKSKLINFDMYFPVIRDVMTYKGRVWGTPWGYNGKVWMVNLDILERDGIAVPPVTWTYQDMLDIAKKTTQPDAGTYGAGLSTDYIGDIQWLLNWSGHDWLNADRTQMAINDPHHVELWTLWRNMMDQYQVTPRKGASWLNGNVALQETWSTELYTMGASGTTFRWQMQTYPAGPAGQHDFAQGHLWTVNANTKQPAAAWRLAEWLGSRNAEQVWADTHRTPPQVPDRELWNTYYGQLSAADRAKAIDFIDNTLYGQGYAQNFTYWRGFWDMQSIYNEDRARILKGEPIANVLDDMQTRMSAVLADANK